jgi:hypothetical protein
MQVTIALSLIHIFYNSLQHALSLFSLLCLNQSLSSNGFQRRTFPLLWIPELSPCLSYQLTATFHKARTSDSLTQRPTHFASVNSNALHSLIVLLITPRHGPHRKHRPYVAPFIVAYEVISTGSVENTAFQPVHWRMLGIFCLPRELFAESLVSNGSSCYSII